MGVVVKKTLTASCEAVNDVLMGVGMIIRRAGCCSGR